MKQNKIRAFTLVELIVVITILAILWTIAFISLQWYSKVARDSTRISDISVMRTGLELFYLNSWKFPIPTNSFDVTYSWSITWTQWYFWDDTFKNVEKLDKIPVDPLTSKEYTYSVTKTRQEYQIAWIIEWDELSFMNSVNAWDTITKALVNWNYNGMLIKSQTGVNCEVLSLPSIISSQSDTTTELTTILTNSWLVYSWYNNLPTNYRTSKYNADGWFWFISNKLVVYSDANNCSDLNNWENSTVRYQLLNNLQTAYSWTTLENKSNINNILSLDLSPSNDLKIFSASFLNSSLIWDIDIWNIENGPITSWVCWIDDGLNFESNTITNLCQAWTSSSIIDNGVWFTFDWTCDWINWWLVANCSANHIAGPSYQNVWPFDLDLSYYNNNYWLTNDTIRTVSVDVDLSVKGDGYILGLWTYTNYNPTIWHNGIVLTANWDLQLADKYIASSYDLYPYHVLLPAAQVPDQFNLTVELEHIINDEWNVYVAIDWVFLTTYNYNRAYAPWGIPAFWWTIAMDIGDPNWDDWRFWIAWTLSNFKVWQWTRVYWGVDFN